MMLDEPSLGPVAACWSRRVFRMIRELAAEGLTVLLVEQNARQALGVADRGYVLSTGTVSPGRAGRGLMTGPSAARELPRRRGGKVGGDRRPRVAVASSADRHRHRHRRRGSVGRPRRPVRRRGRAGRGRRDIDLPRAGCNGGPDRGAPGAVARRADHRCRRPLRRRRRWSSAPSRTAGGIDILHNNAYWAPLDISVPDTTIEQWDRTIAVTLTGVFLGCKYAIPR